MSPASASAAPSLAEESFRNVLPHLPGEAAPSLPPLLDRLPVLVRAVPSRATKHGDHRLCDRRGHSLVTVNQCGNGWRFFITLLHELAHAEVALTHGPRTPPHGRAWKSAFRRMLLDRLPLFPADLRGPVFRYAMNPLYSSDSDVTLSQALRAYDTLDHRPTLAEVATGQRFTLNGRDLMVKHERVRKNFRCTTPDGRTYRVSPSARVTPCPCESAAPPG